MIRPFQKTVCNKRSRVIQSDDEEEMELKGSYSMHHCRSSSALTCDSIWLFLLYSARLAELFIIKKYLKLSMISGTNPGQFYYR